MNKLFSTRTAHLAATLAAALLLAGCSQWRMMRCVNDIVDRNGPYQTDADRDDSEQLARQTCRERAESKGN